MVHCSSEDPEFPATELNAHSPHTLGWQSARFCEYPQVQFALFENFHRRVTRDDLLLVVNFSSIPSS